LYSERVAVRFRRGWQYRESEGRFVVKPRKAMDGTQVGARAVAVGAKIEGTGLEGFIGESPSLLSVTQKIPLVAKTDAAVLIRGETGTGKELCARAIHYLSPRAGGPFIVENCGRIPPELIANEFFGHESGAYTGAIGGSKGLIGQAQGGTLVLDEIDSLPFASQAVFLRFLQDRRYQRLGGQNLQTANVRVIAATNLELDVAVERGQFRRDLYYRLKVAELVLPPLRHRVADVDLLASHFVRKYAHEFYKAVRRLSPECSQRLKNYHWPGNVRELEAVIEEAVLFSNTETLQENEINLPAPSSGQGVSLTFKVAKARALKEFECNYLARAFESAGKNISKAGRLAGMSAGAMWRLLRKHSLIPGNTSTSPRPRPESDVSKRRPGRTAEHVAMLFLQTSLYFYKGVL
jgi:two-component system response regulator GlrR